MMKFLNAFSINMIETPRPGNSISVRFIAITTGGASRLVKKGIDSFIGHADTARVLSNVVGTDILAHRGNVRLEDGETALLAQYIGPRLPEGTTVLPEGAEINFFLVEIGQEESPHESEG